MSTARIAVVDTETTGLYPSSDRLIELAIVLLEVERATGRVSQDLARYEGLEDPGFPIPALATSIHGITNAMVKGHRIDRTAVSRLLGSADLLVAHNSGFDKGFVAQVCPEAKEMTWACSCRGVPWRKFFPQAPNAKLQDLADTFQLPKGTAHRALGDVETTLRLLALPVPGQPRTVLGHLMAAKLR